MPLFHYVGSLVSTFVVALTLGIYVLWKHPDRRVNRLYFIYSIAVCWWSMGQLLAGVVDDPILALWFARLFHWSVVFLPTLLIHFFSAVTEISQRRILRLAYPISLIWFVYSFTPGFIPSVHPYLWFPYFLQAGPIYLVFNIVFLIGIAYASVFLWWAGSQATGQRRIQLRLLWWAFVIGYTTCMTNFFYFYRIYVPILQPYATYGGAVAFGLIGYIVFRYQLFDIVVVLRKSLVYVLLVSMISLVYLALVLGAERLFQQYLGYRALPISLAAAVCMALLFTPLKNWIQALVDRVFFGGTEWELAQKVERMEQELRHADKMKAVATLAAGMAHEIKTPLTSVKTFMEYMPKKLDDREFLMKVHGVVSEGIERVDRTVRDLLEFARPTPPKREPVDLLQVLTQTADFLSSEFIKRRIRVERNFHAPTAIVSVDKHQFRQVFLNLLLNASEAMPDGGTITLASRLVENARPASEKGPGPFFFELAISDTGCGIPPDQLPHLFEPFYTTKESGTGLGLSICHTIVTDHGGTLRAASHPGLGTTFTIQLPIEGGEEV